MMKHARAFKANLALWETQMLEGNPSHLLSIDDGADL